MPSRVTPATAVVVSAPVSTPSGSPLPEPLMNFGSSYSRTALMMSSVAKTWKNPMSWRASHETSRMSPAMNADRVFCDNVGDVPPNRLDPVPLGLDADKILFMKRNKLLALPLAIALGLEIIAPGGEGAHPHTEKEIILAPEPIGADADSLRPFVTPPENPWLMDYALRVLKPEELGGWWVNTNSTRSGGLVTVMRTQTCGEVRFKELAVIKNLNTNQEITTPVFLNEDYCISSRNRKMC